MDIAEMKIASQNKGSAKTNGPAAKGAALAAVMVKYAWTVAEEQEKRKGKLLAFVKEITALDEDGHRAFRAELSTELAAIKEMEKSTGTSDSKKAGYSLNSFIVMVSNWRAISEAAQIGGKDEINGQTDFYAALETAREYRKSHAMTGAAVVNSATGGKATGAGRKALTDYDKAFRLVAKLNLKDMRKMAATLAVMIEAAETTPRKRKSSADLPALH